MRDTKAASRARRLRGDESRAKLIEAAGRLIADRGFGATSIGDICRAAGVAKTALYWHFDSKEGLLAAVLQSVGGSWIDELQKHAYLETSPARRLDRLIDDCRRLVTEQPRLVRLPLFVQLELDEHSTQALREALRGFVGRAERALAQGIEDSLGDHRVSQVDAVAGTVLSLLQAAVSRTTLAEREADVDAIFDELKRTIVLVILSRVPEAERAKLVAELGSGTPTAREAGAETD